jgi:hypothetical protein
VIVYVVRADVAVGVPEIKPVVVLKASPAGRLGEIEKESSDSPVWLNVYLAVGAEFAVQLSVELEM